jgi:hypothetical protein
MKLVKSFLSILCFFLFLCLPWIALSQVPVPESITETVTFLFTENPPNYGVGTGFFVTLNQDPNSIYLCRGNVNMSG